MHHLGVAGTAMLTALWALYMSIRALIRIVFWKSKGVVGKGVIKNLKSTEYIFKNAKKDRVESTIYTYEIEITAYGQVFTDVFTETVSGSKLGKVNFGAEYDILWDEDKKKYFNYTEGKKEAWLYPLVFVGSTAVLILCAWIVTGLR